MARIRIVHTTEYSYRRPVGLLRHELMVRPDDSHDLRLHEAVLKIHPKPSAIRWAHDVFDNAICYVDWPAELRTELLSIVSELDLTHHPDGAPSPTYILSPVAELFPFSYAFREIPDVARVAERQQPDPERSVDAWARRFIHGSARRRTLDVLEDMTHAIKDEFRYEARYQHGTQAAAETIALGSGTCRDFAVLMMEAVRSFGLGARFVTGYLYDDACGATRGGGSTHAWCSVYLPGAGWVEYDPTNGLVAGANLLRGGATRTAEQAIPVAGGYLGDADDPAGMYVDVSVTAGPIRRDD
jgi:transglutaminase-like putative cysteine protease